MPTSEQVEAALNLIARGVENYNYFFSQLKDSSWINPLKGKGLFEIPPSARRNAEGKVVGAPPWPPSQFLARVASKAPEEVLQIAVSIKTDNFWIVRDFSEAALAMPPPAAAKWAEHMAQWLRDENAMLGCAEDALGQLISKLGKAGESSAGLMLARELLTPLPDPEAEKKKTPKDNYEEILYSTLEPQLRCDRYQFEQILQKSISDLVTVAPVETVRLLCDLLIKAIKYSAKNPEKQKPVDVSEGWRPAIEDHEQNRDYDFRSHLVTAIRDAAESCIQKTPSRTSAIITLIEGYKWEVFQRIGLHLLRVGKDAPAELIREHLLNKDIFCSPAFRHEYFHLLKTRFPNLPKDDKATLLGWIEEAAEEKEYQKNHEQSVTKEQSEHRIHYWQYRKLAALEGHLEGVWKDRLALLMEEFKNMDIPPDFGSYMGEVREGSQSPKTAEELSRMNIEELVMFLKTWRSSGQWMEPTPSGLGAKLQTLVVEAPGKYTDNISLFMSDDMDPTYIRHLVYGLNLAFSSDKNVDFASVLRLCKWVVEKPRSAENPVAPKTVVRDFDADKDWRPARLDVARLLEKALKKEGEVPFELRHEIWAVLEKLAGDPEPDAEYEKKYGGDNMDPLNLSLNTIRGCALHAIMDYSCWVCGNINKEEIEKIEVKHLKEVFDVLEDHLNPERDCSQTSRAVYGQWLPWFILYFTDWAKANLRTMFPKAEELKPLRQALWNAYLMYSSLNTHVFDFLKEIYREEAEGLFQADLKSKRGKRHSDRLVEHLMLFYSHGKITLEKEDLISRFFVIAPSQLKQHALDFLGRHYHSLHKKDDRKPDVIERGKNLWEWRIKEVGGWEKMANEELSAFGWWFASGLFDKQWSFDYLEKVLKRTTISRPNLFTFERMSDDFAGHQIESLRCLELFLERNDDPLLFFSKDKGVWTILQQGLASSDQAVREKTEGIVHLLGSKGFSQYRELLRKPSSSI